MVTLDEAKNYLKVDTDLDDALIEDCLNGAIRYVKDILRVEDFKDFKKKEKSLIKVAIFYALHFLYEGRGNADHHELMKTIRSLLSGLRSVKF